MTPFVQETFDGCISDILEACARIERYTAEYDETSFAASELVQDAVVYNLRVIGKCARTLENHVPLFMQLDTGLPGRFSYPTRDARHGPGSLDHRLPDLWVFIRRYLPVMMLKVRAARQKFLAEQEAKAVQKDVNG